VEDEKAQALKKTRSIEKSRYEDNRHVAEQEDDIVFEDFARSRLTEQE
jgi:arrestin-2